MQKERIFLQCQHIRTTFFSTHRGDAFWNSLYNNGRFYVHVAHFLDGFTILYINFILLSYSLPVLCIYSSNSLLYQLLYKSGYYRPFAGNYRSNLIYNSPISSTGYYL